MKTGTIVLIVICILVVCCAYTHPRVIKALLGIGPMPKALAWHFWVKKENRRN